MQVILLKELQGRGGEGDVVNVARGFANNYLLRQGIAVKATKGNLKQLEQRRANIEKREVERVNNANELAEKLNGLKVKVDAAVGEEGILFGSVTSAMIADALKNDHEVEVDKRRIELGKPIKVVGNYKVNVNIYRQIGATIEVLVGVDEEKSEDAKAAHDAVKEAVESKDEETLPNEDNVSESEAEQAPAAENA
jgi:large subunit ribosomal protein L9